MKTYTIVSNRYLNPGHRVTLAQLAGLAAQAGLSTRLVEREGRIYNPLGQLVACADTLNVRDFTK